MAIALSQGTIQRLEKLFGFPDRAAVANLLVEECGSNLALSASSTPEDLERIRFAVLKLSDGDVTKLLEAIELAQIDWRDLLVAAGFADDLRAHSVWWPP
jgi:hypothetical protein